ncbi:hypothetical protein [Tautonia plasticadhaerens]|uniref:Uncharacterized protein n=1 Tax=Tautonia plasticadhaerens TaxID=2527974 RepID=A0A518GWE5_9BACT|nr:hypothetical protein [Tautonia plasticadhaerens]QDV32903.1 hypothetical protein ElP_07430 [Tautonia plasticadhaerens]
MYASHGDRYLAFVGRPSRFSAVLIRRERLDGILSRLSRFEGIRSLNVPSGLSEAELGRIRSALPGAEVVVDPRFDAGRDSIRIYGPTQAN